MSMHGIPNTKNASGEEADLVDPVDAEKAHVRKVEVVNPPDVHKNGGLRSSSTSLTFTPSITELNIIIIGDGLDHDHETPVQYSP